MTLLIGFALVLLSVSFADTDLRLVSYNVQSFPDKLQSALYIKNDGRVEYIHDQLLDAAAKQFGTDAPPDIICFQEAFSDVLHKLTSVFAHRHGYHYAQPGEKSIWRGEFVNSGVMLLSATPFLHLEYHGFPKSTACGFDLLAAKGFIYAEIAKDDVRVGIVATHLQAEDPLCVSSWGSAAANANRKQAQQLAEIQAFLERQKSADRPPVDAVFLLGDLNVDALDKSRDPAVISWEKVRPMLGAVHAQPMTMTMTAGARASFDPSSNNFHVQMQTKNAPAAEHLDYVLALGAADARVQSAVVPVRSGANDLSDHHAIMAQAQIRGRTTPGAGGGQD